MTVLPAHPAVVGRVAAATAVGATAAVALAQVTDRDGVRDVAAGALHAAGLVASWHWPYLVAVLLLGAVHYLAAAAVARAAAGVPLPLRQNVAVQLAASAANRLTPAGLGGSAVIARYLTRRGLAVRTAVGVVGAIAVLGALADVLAFGVIALVSAANPVPAIVSRAASHLPRLTSPVVWLVAAALLGAAGWLVARRRAVLVRLFTGPEAIWRPAVAVARRPRDLAVLLGASAGTTVVLALAFVAALHAVPGADPAAPLGTVLVGFMLAAAAGSSLPLPAALGATEAALTAAAVGLGAPLGAAAAAVLTFRAVTFWAPAGLGVLAARSLRRSQAL